MFDEYLIWVHDSRVPSKERIRLEGLVTRLENALRNRNTTDAASIKLELVNVCRELREYTAAIETWEGEGGH